MAPAERLWYQSLRQGLAARWHFLRIEGTCRGTFVVDRNLTLSGKDNATLDGNGAKPVLSIGAGTRVVVETLTVTGGVSSATAADGRAVGGIGTGFFGASRTKLTRSRVTANTAKASSATGGLYQIAGNGDYELERTTVSTNTPVNCNFDCQRRAGPPRPPAVRSLVKPSVRQDSARLRV